jgi:hypothetical protein
MFKDRGKTTKNKLVEKITNASVNMVDVHVVENNIIRGEIAHSKTRDHTSM